MRNEKAAVKEFKKRYKLKKIELDGLTSIVQEQGYTLVSFKLGHNNEKVQFLIDALQIEQYICSCKCFTFQNDKVRLVFLNDDLSVYEKIIVLSHELGHIWHNHLVSDSVFGSDVQQEHQANEFSHYLLSDISGKKSKIHISVAVIMFVLAASFIGVFTMKFNGDKDIYTEKYYHTASGTKCHLKNCIYLETKKKIYRVTKDEYDSGKYEPCSVCIRFDNDSE